MAFLSQEALEQFNFKKLGSNVLISDKASIYSPELIEIDDCSRIDDFCVISGRVSIGRNVHIAVFWECCRGRERGLPRRFFRTSLQLPSVLHTV